MISLEHANLLLEKASLTERIRWAEQTFGDGLVLTTSFGTYSAVMLHVVATMLPGAAVISIDTGHNDQTRAFAAALAERLGIQVHRYTIPPPPPSEVAPLESHEEYLQRHKVDLMEAALKRHGATAWMSGVQRNETDHRREFNFLMRRADGLYKFHPLLDWDARRLFHYCKEHALPINDAYVDPAKGANQKQECGIHLTGLANQSFTSSEL